MASLAVGVWQWREQIGTHDRKSSLEKYERSSKGMEAIVALQLVKRAYKKCRFIVAFIVSDNDSTMKALLRQRFDKIEARKKAGDPKYGTWKQSKRRTRAGKISTVKNVGKLPMEIDKPQWLADPTHLTKVVMKLISKLANRSKENKYGCTKCNAVHLKK